jgi:hypothetical protein
VSSSGRSPSRKRAASGVPSTSSRFRFGSAIFNDSFPRVWYLNLLRIDRPDGATLEALAGEAERLHGARGHEHRRVVVPDDDAGLGLAPGFRSLGWKLEREVLMAFGGRGDKGGGAATAEEVTWEALRPLREEVARNDPRATEEVVRELLDANALAAQAGRARQFAVRVKGRIVSAADLYSDGRTAQVEDVVTLTQHRGHGYATAEGSLRPPRLRADRPQVELPEGAPRRGREQAQRSSRRARPSDWRDVRTPAKRSPSR